MHQSDLMRHFEFPEILEVLQLLERHSLLFLAAAQFPFGCDLMFYKAVYGTATAVKLYKDGGVFCPGGFT